jgi:hypothetical protein
MAGDISTTLACSALKADMTFVDFRRLSPSHFPGGDRPRQMDVPYNGHFAHCRFGMALLCFAINLEIADAEVLRTYGHKKW